MSKASQDTSGSSKNSSRVYDLRRSANSKPFTVSFLFCMCKSTKVTPVTYLLKFYTLEIINTVFCMLLAISYFVLHRLSILKVYDQSTLERQLVIVAFILSTIFFMTKLLIVSSNRKAVKNTMYSNSLSMKDSFCKCVNYTILLLLGYFAFATAHEGLNVYKSRTSQVKASDKKYATLVGLALLVSSGGILL